MGGRTWDGGDSDKMSTGRGGGREEEEEEEEDGRLNFEPAFRGAGPGRGNREGCWRGGRG
jgi:hypothetical protein